jgi:hypothetical protein
MGYCHCTSCRSWSGGPVNAFSLWKPQAVRIASGAEHVATLFTSTTPRPLRMRDGLPKLKDFPAEFGGSGEMIAE